MGRSRARIDRDQDPDQVQDEPDPAREDEQAEPEPDDDRIHADPLADPAGDAEHHAIGRAPREPSRGRRAQVRGRMFARRRAAGIGASP